MLKTYRRILSLYIIFRMSASGMRLPDRKGFPFSFGKQLPVLPTLDAQALYSNLKINHAIILSPTRVRVKRNKAFFCLKIYFVTFLP